MPAGLPTARIRRAPESNGMQPWRGGISERLTRGRANNRLERRLEDRGSSMALVSIVGPRIPLGGDRRGKWGHARPGCDVTHVVSVGDCFTARSSGILLQPVANVEQMLKQSVLSVSTFASSLRNSWILRQKPARSRSCGRLRRTLFWLGRQKRVRVRLWRSTLDYCRIGSRRRRHWRRAAAAAIPVPSTGGSLPGFSPASRPLSRTLAGG
jgi:hypothetical protein